MPKVSRLSEENNTSNVWLRKSKAFSNADNFFLQCLFQYCHSTDAER